MIINSFLGSFPLKTSMKSFTNSNILGEDLDVYAESTTYISLFNFALVSFYPGSASNNSIWPAAGHH
jgi:hypothetical protein